jgi:hypothetical protein
MDKIIKQVSELHFLLELPINNLTLLTDSFQVNMFLNPIRNEFEDVATEVQSFSTSKSDDSRVAISNAVGRLIYAALMFGVAFGLDIPGELEAIHKSNLQKAGRLKSEGFFDEL